ncbi:MAG: restriction endonuclease [Candidatus Berkelbacteria bacterium Licking1014_2]|uniref:Restriction endonuclease n=1 Tax=Candidatus Berkelbacteria bacterium Licking1014_2 TaxID=2017146 RepID=A0A554LUH4_9BACT|nr:MAG: restriction endonuclease [Candidatus Berkelbacteria bacterium Licking1014_2]
MTIPDYQTIMLPLLKLAGDKKEHSTREAIDSIADLFKLSDEQKKEVLPSGKSYIIDNRVGWARTYLKKAGLLEDTRRSHFRITEEGLEALAKSPTEINIKFLQQFPGFNEFRKKKDDEEDGQEQIIQEDSSQTPQELLEYGYQKIKRDLAQELLESVKKVSPRFFEQLVVELLLKMGYGGSLKDAGKAIGQSGDGGIDGIIKEDKLGLDVIYIQAKRWENVVGSKEIRNFVGSLVGQKANKGVFITTSGFTKDALEYVKTITHKVILIDGEMLAQLMIENNVGVSGVISYEVKKIDSDYFIEE